MGLVFLTKGIIKLMLKVNLLVDCTKYTWCICNPYQVLVTASTEVSRNFSAYILSRHIFDVFLKRDLRRHEN